MPKSPPPVNFQWAFLVSKGTVSGVSGGFRFGSSHGATRLVTWGNTLSAELCARFGLLEHLWRLHWTRCLLPNGLSKRVWQTCPIFSTAAVARTNRLCTLSTTGSGFARFGVTLRSGRHASIPNSSCCLTLATSWTMLTLCIELRSVWCFSRS